MANSVAGDTLVDVRALCAIGGGLLGAGVVYGVIRARRAGLFSGFPFGAAASPPSKDSAGVHIRQIRRYAFAASQDKSPVVGLTHASYALVLLDTLEEVVGRDAISKAGYDASKIRAFITALQDMHAENLKPCDSHLQNVLAIERGEGGQIPGFVVAGWGGAPRGA